MSGKKKKGGKKNRAIPVAVMAPMAIIAIKDIQLGGGAAGIANRITEDVTGYNVISGSFDASQAMPFWLGELAGIVVHKVAGKVGVNRQVKKLTFGYLEL